MQGAVTVSWPTNQVFRLKDGLNCHSSGDRRRGRPRAPVVIKTTLSRQRVAPNADQHPTSDCVDQAKRGVRCNDPRQFQVTAIRHRVKVVSLHQHSLPSAAEGAEKPDLRLAPSDRSAPPSILPCEARSRDKAEAGIDNLLIWLARQRLPTRIMAVAAVVSQKRRHRFPFSAALH